MDLDFLKRLAKAITEQFGDNSEVVVHDLTGGDLEHTVVAIENGHVSRRQMGDGPPASCWKRSSTAATAP